MGRFTGQAVFITGASSGIGAALAAEFAREGARVALAARRTEWLERVKSGIEAHGSEAICLACDVTDRASIDTAVQQAVDTFGGLDVAVANAGFGVSGMFERLSTEDFRRQYDVNVFGLIDTVYATLPHLKASQGRLGLVGSVLSRLGIPTSSAYVSSKFAVCGLAESLYYELAEKGVSVTCINPGIVESNIRRTDNKNRLHEDREDPAKGQWYYVTAEKAARDIVHALYRRKPEAVITGHGKAIVWMARHFPRTTRFIIRQGSKGRLDRVEKARRGQPGSAKK